MILGALGGPGLATAQNPTTAPADPSSAVQTQPAATPVHSNQPPPANTPPPPPDDRSQIPDQPPAPPPAASPSAPGQTSAREGQAADTESKMQQGDSKAQ